MSNIDLGKINFFSLDNNISLYTCINNKAPVATFQAWIRTGSVNEGHLAGSGISHCLEHMIFKGSKKYTREEINSTIDSLGGKINAYTSYFNTVYHVNIPSQNIINAAKVIIDIIRNPLLPEDELLREKEVILREISMRNDVPEIKLFERMLQSMFRYNPLKHPIIGYKNIFQNITIQNLIDYHRQTYRPENIFFLACGNINPDEIFQLIKKECDDWENPIFYTPPTPSDPPQIAPQKSIAFFDDPLARIAIGFHSPSLTDPLSPVFDILALLLGGDESSRLVSKLEKKKSLAIEIEASHFSSPSTGILSTSASTTPEKITELEGAIFDELYSLNSKLPPQKEELDRIANQISTSFLKSLRSINNIASLIGKSILFYSDPEYSLRYLDIINSITVDELSEVANLYLKPENSTTVLLLPLKSQSFSVSSTVTSNYNFQKVVLHKETNIPKLLVYQDDSLPIFDVMIASIGGTITESKENSGISELLSETLPCGTKTKSEEEINKILDENAITISFSATKELFLITLSAKNSNFTLAVDTLCEILSSPAFNPEITAREKNNIIEQLKSDKLSVINAANDLIFKTLYKNHPFGFNSDDILNALPSLHQKDLIEHYDKFFFPLNQSIIGIAGSFSEIQFNYLISCLKSLRWKSIPLIDNIKIPEPFVGRELKTSSIPREQSLVALSFPSCSLRDEKKYSLALFSLAINSMNSKLFTKIREENALAYYTGMSPFLASTCGHISFYAGISAENTEKTLSLIHEECKKMAEKPITIEEFNSAKEKIKLNIAESYLNPATQITLAAKEELLGLGLDSFNKQMEIFQNLNYQTLQNDLSRILSSQNFIEVIINPQKK